MNDQSAAGCDDTDCPCIDFTPVLTESVSFLQSPHVSEAPSTALLAKATSNIWTTVLALVQMLGPKLLEFLPQLEAQALAVYDQLAASLDIPAIPNTFEPTLKAILRGFIVQGFAALKLLPPVDPQLMRSAPSMVLADEAVLTSMRAAQDKLDELAETLVV